MFLSLCHCFAVVSFCLSVNVTTCLSVCACLPVCVCLCQCIILCFCVFNLSNYTDHLCIYCLYCPFILHLYFTPLFCFPVCTTRIHLCFIGVGVLWIVFTAVRVYGTQDGQHPGYIRTVDYGLPDSNEGHRRGTLQKHCLVFLCPQLLNLQYNEYILFLKRCGCFFEVYLNNTDKLDCIVIEIIIIVFKKACANFVVLRRGKE